MEQTAITRTLIWYFIFFFVFLIFNKIIDLPADSAAHSPLWAIFGSFLAAYVSHWPARAREKSPNPDFCRSGANAPTPKYKKSGLWPLEMSMFILIWPWNLCYNLLAKPSPSYTTCSVTKYIWTAEHIRPSYRQTCFRKKMPLNPMPIQPNTNLTPTQC